MLFAHKYVKMDEAGDGKDGSGDDAAAIAKAANDAAAAASKQQIELLTKSVGLLAEGLKNMEGNQANIVAALAKITDQSKGDVKKGLEDQFGDDVDLEQLDRKDFARFILAQSKGDIQGEVKKLSDVMVAKIDDLGGRFESKNAGEQVEKTASDHKDFWEWSNEIKGVLKDNPTLTVRRAYALVRSENPEKAKEMDKKYNQHVDKKQGFIGLTPTR